jgi:hypothetical protein
MRTINSTKPASLALAFTLILAILAFGVASAQAASPWWHLSAGARPTYLHALASNPRPPEVQEIFTEPGEYQGVSAQTNFKLELLAAGEGHTPDDEFITEPLCERFCTPGSGQGDAVLLLTAENLQKALEENNGYGPHTVTVTEAATDSNGHPLENGDKRYIITTPGPVAPVAVKKEIGNATARVVTSTTDDGEIVVTAENTGDARTTGAAGPVTFTDVLPRGLRAVGVVADYTENDLNNQLRTRFPCTLEEVGGVATATCSTEDTVLPYDQLEMRIAVDVENEVAGDVNDEVSISGGGGPPASVTRPITISDAPVAFGLEHYDLDLEEEGGAPATQAAVHPFQLTTAVDFNELPDTAGSGDPYTVATEAGLTKDVSVKLPAGLIGNPTPIPQCTDAQFTRYHLVLPSGSTTEDYNECPASSAIGVALVTVDEPRFLETATLAVPIFNLEPEPGEPARFGFFVTSANAPVYIDTAVRSGSDYGVTATVSDVTQIASLVSSTLTFWGVPADARHNTQRGWGCLAEARGTSGPERFPCIPAEQTTPPPFLVLPSSCAAPLSSEVETDSWEHPGAFQSIKALLPPERALSGCNRLQFDPQITLAPDGQEASKPTGLTVDVHVPQAVNENDAGLASSDVKNITVAFPEGVVVNPASADGLKACGEGEVGLQPGEGAQGEFLFTPVLGEPFCPDASKIGTVTIKSPLLPKGQNVEGSLYLADPAPNGEPGKNPFNTLVASYIVATDPVSGTIVKLPGSVSLDPNTGRLTATFENQPQLAFEDAEIHLFGGERAPLATPSHCGTYTTDATFTPWSGTGPVKSSSSFKITSGPGGGPCPPEALTFNPTLAAGSPNVSAGSFSPLTTTISREDGNQNINKVQLHFAPGMSGILAGIPLCHEAEANAGTCPESSLIGKTIVSVGLGGDPFSVTGGKVFLTEKYEGSPFGLSIVNPAVAGPFDLGKVIVRAKIEVDPRTAALTVTTGEIPHILDGIPLQIKHVNVTIDRPGFTFNPTNCNPQQVTGTIGGVEGASSPVAVPFQVTNCASLKFAPKFAVSTQAKTSKANGASLHVKLTYPYGPQGTYANIAKVKVELPKALPSRLTTLQKACTAAQFEANPAACPSPSVIGYANAVVPNIPVPLEGPVYFVSHGGEAFPSLEIVLQGYGVKIVLVGSTFISKSGITSTTFKTIPDNPVSSFELTLPEGKYSALAANGNLCTQKLVMPVGFTAQNGATFNQNTPIGVTGCAKKKALTRTQKLKASLRACHKKHNKGKREACVRAARKRFGTKSKTERHR